MVEESEDNLLSCDLVLMERLGQQLPVSLQDPGVVGELVQLLDVVLPVVILPGQTMEEQEHKGKYKVAWEVEYKIEYSIEDISFIF